MKTPVHRQIAQGDSDDVDEPVDETYLATPKRKRNKKTLRDRLTKKPTVTKNRPLKRGNNLDESNSTNDVLLKERPKQKDEVENDEDDEPLDETNLVKPKVTQSKKSTIIGGANDPFVHLQPNLRSNDEHQLNLATSHPTAHLQIKKNTL